MATHTQPQSGHVGKLTASEGQKLREFWRILIQSWDTSMPAPEGASGKVKSAPKGHRRLFSLGRAFAAPPTPEETSAIPPNLLATLKVWDAGPGDIKTIQSLMVKFPGVRLRFAFLAALKQDHPDALLLRFLRAEKWNLPKAWIKFAASLNWRINEYKVDREVMLKGEAYALEKSQARGISSEKKDAQGFALQLTSGKAFFHGCDRWNRPVCIVRVRSHDPNTQTQKAINDYIVYCMETVRLLQVSPVETLVVVFDLTSFTLANWDFPSIKFVIDCFQENYPESLGAMILYNAPWVFSGMWKIIQGILDPVVAAKVHFINGAQELEKVIARDRILKELGGDEDWEYTYIEPGPEEKLKLKDKAARDVILAEREQLGDELFSLTAEWIANQDSRSLYSRNDVIEELRRNYWDLDPYVRVRSILDRTGIIKGDGLVDFYPAPKPKSDVIEDDIAESEIAESEVPETEVPGSECPENEANEKHDPNEEHELDGEHEPDEKHELNEKHGLNEKHELNEKHVVHEKHGVESDTLNETPAPPVAA
ncbi:unnamed protein product [Penicillium olsonii]|nr:unnamed protein product [Penicillium olsonii]CAG7927669.1 unnamed protein product [Penicillium olsonii]